MNEIFLDFIETSAILSVIIVAVALLSAIIDKKFTAKWKYWIWLIIALRLIIPFTPNLTETARKIELAIPNRVITAPVEEEEPQSSTDFVPVIPEKEPVSTQNPVLSTDGSVVHNGKQELVFEHEVLEHEEEALSTEESFNISFFDVGIVLWISGAVIFFIWNLFVYHSFKRRMRTEKIPKEGMERVVLEQVKRELFIKKNIDMLFCENITSPMVMGFFKPKVILPKEIYGEEELYFILCHELTHYKRRDVMYKTLLLVANALHWFNPAVWLMRKLAGSDLEISCDSMVVGKGDIELRKRYSETILASVHRENVACSAFMTHFYGGKKTLKKRFANIFNVKKRRRGTAAFIAVIMVAVFLGGTVSCVIDEEEFGKLGEFENEGSIPDPSRETLLKVEELFEAYNGDKISERSDIITVGRTTENLALIQNFLAYAANKMPASLMGIYNGFINNYVFELSYDESYGIIIRSFDNNDNRYAGYIATKVYETDLFYYLTDKENIGFAVPKYSELAVTEDPNYVKGEDIPGAVLTAYDAGSEIRTIHSLRTLYESDLAWDSYGMLIPEDFFPIAEEDSDDDTFFAGETEGAATVNGESYYKVAVYEYDINKNKLPYDGTLYYICASNPDKIFYFDRNEETYIPIVRIYDSKFDRGGNVSAPFVLDLDSEPKELNKGDKLGDWTLTRLEREYNDWPTKDEVKAKFYGKSEIEGYLERDPMSETEYIFTLKAAELHKIPHYVDEEFNSKDTSCSFRINIPSDVYVPNIGYNEMQPVKVTVNSIELNETYISGGPSNIDVTAVEETGEKLTENYKSSFKLGVNGYVNSVYVGGKIGEWTLEELNSYYDNNYSAYRVWATFTGDVLFEGEVKKTGSDSGEYEFTISDADLERMPYFVERYHIGTGKYIAFDLSASCPKLENLAVGESTQCVICVSEYYYVDDGTSALNKATVTSVTVGKETYNQLVGTAKYSLGRDGKTEYIKPGETVGEWTLWGYNEIPSRNSAEGEFSGEVTLRGKILENTSENDYKYIFVISEDDMDKIPYLKGYEVNYSEFYIDWQTKIEIPEDLGADGTECEIVATRYCYYTEPHMGYSNYLTVSEVNFIG